MLVLSTKSETFIICLIPRSASYYSIRTTLQLILRAYLVVRGGASIEHCGAEHRNEDNG